jgi:hypothetical protein
MNLATITLEVRGIRGSRGGMSVLACGVTPYPPFYMHATKHAICGWRRTHGNCMTSPLPIVGRTKTLKFRFFFWWFQQIEYLIKKRGIKS